MISLVSFPCTSLGTWPVISVTVQTTNSYYVEFADYEAIVAGLPSPSSDPCFFLLARYIPGLYPGSPCPKSLELRLHMYWSW